MCEGFFGVGEERLVVLEGGGRDGGGSGRGAVEIELLVDLVDLGGSGDGLLGLDRALDDRVVMLNLLNRGVILSIENSAVTLAGHGLGVEGVGWALGNLENGEDAGLLEAEAAVGTPVVSVVVQVEHGEVELGLRNHGHADVGVLVLGHTAKLLALERCRGLCSDHRSRGRWHRGHCGLGLESLVARELLEEGSESLVAEQTLDKGTRAGVLLHQETVLGPEFVRLVDLDGNFTFKLANVF